MRPSRYPSSEYCVRYETNYLASLQARDLGSDRQAGMPGFQIATICAIGVETTGLVVHE